ncbi:uncharacterized protein EI90DRAFT_3053103 [Cantharellus anzutake]|uniref:uncharacterized protein n=1 Tax=Cantharellus anzutake TaxID=1750568 RepID=UPI0019076F02|nr:uncharacterized protein EI90DRAFT_3053103 [Cantharellus anzutake]KAF8333133.1 hypothetical protein EI90DRAFT_3053103 [Cantharellus anzutake]
MPIRSLERVAGHPGSSKARGHRPSPHNSFTWRRLGHPTTPSTLDQSKRPNVGTHQQLNTSLATPPLVAGPLDATSDNDIYSKQAEVSSVDLLCLAPADVNISPGTDASTTERAYACSPTEPSSPSFKFGPPGSTYLPLVVEGTVFDLCYPPGRSTEDHRKLFDDILREEEALEMWHDQALEVSSSGRPATTTSDSFRLGSRWSHLTELEYSSNTSHLIDDDIPLRALIAPNCSHSPSFSALESLDDGSSYFSYLASPIFDTQTCAAYHSPRVMEGETGVDILQPRIAVEDPRVRAVKQQRRKGMIFHNGFEGVKGSNRHSVPSEHWDVLRSPFGVSGNQSHSRERASRVGERFSKLRKWSSVEFSRQDIRYMQERQRSYSKVDGHARKRFPGWKRLLLFWRRD